MTYNVTRSKLPPADAARIMGLNPLHFQGVQIDEFQRQACDAAWVQEGWQNSDSASREEVGQALAQAEADIEAHLNYRLLPAWEFDEFRPTTPPYHNELVNLNNRDVRGFGQTIDLDWKHLVAGGIRSKELVRANEAIVWTSTRAPADYLDIGTVTFTLAVDCPECEIRVYHPGKAGADEWEIRPVDVQVNATSLVTTITFNRELAVLADRLDALVAEATTGIDDDEFEAEVDVYRVYNDPQQQVQMLWEPPDGITSGAPGAYGTQFGYLMGRDLELSQASYFPGTWDETALGFTTAALAVKRQPDLLRVWYYSGMRSKGLACAVRDMDREWARTVTILALSRMDRPPCGCAQTWWQNWSVDLSFAGGADQMSSYRLSMRDLANPIGTRRGEVYAWNRVKRSGQRVASWA